jgi:hypothetical protein
MRAVLNILWFSVSFVISVRIMTFLAENWEVITKGLGDSGISAWHIAGMILVGFFLFAHQIQHDERMQELRKQKEKEDSYESSEPRDVLLPTNLSLAELLTDDGEIPDHLLSEEDNNAISK